MQRAGSEIKDAELSIVGLQSAQARIRDAVRKRESLFVVGPPGSGKSRLLRLAAEYAGRDAMHLDFRPVPHQLLAAFAALLIRASHRPFIRLAAPTGEPERWAAHQTSARIKGLIWSALETEPRLVLLDGVENASYPVYRFFQRLYHAPGMRMIVAARHPAGMGALQRLFWDPRLTLWVSLLTEAEALELFELAAGHFRLRGLDLEDFRPRVIESAQGNPGQIIEMCRMAANPQYVSGVHVKFAPLRIDMMARFLP